MTTPRFATIVGLVIGAVWAFTGFYGALLTGLLGGVGYLLALVVQGQLDLSDPFGNRDRQTTS
jgi:hypothetical protein